jgi:hypothetical protein
MPMRSATLHASGRSALLAKQMTPLVEGSATWTNEDIKQQLGALSYAGSDVSISLDEVNIESRDGHLVIWHTYEIPYWEDVPEVMQRESRRCLALAVALHGSNIENTTGGTSAFESVTWVLNDGHDNNYFALVDDGDVAYTGTRALDLFPQADGFLLSDTIYVSISRRESGIPPRSGQTPRDIDGNPIVCEGWLSVPDELWLVGLPETSENTDDSGYWYEGEIEIESPSTWYEEFKEDATEQDDEPEIIIIDDEGGNEGGEGPDVPVVIDPDNPDSGESGDEPGPPIVIDPDNPGGDGGDGGDTGGDGGGDTGGDTGGDGGGDVGGDTGGDGGGDTGGDGGGDGGDGLTGASTVIDEPIDNGGDGEDPTVGA